MLELVLQVVQVLGITLLALWGVSILIGKASFIDSFWGAGFVLIIWAAFFADTSPAQTLGLGNTQKLALILVSAWGLRLAIYLLIRFLSEGEDRRYKSMLRGKEGLKRHIFTLYFVFGMQGIFMLIISAPTMALMASPPADFTIFSYAGAALWLVGAVFEWGGDWQLARFKAKEDNAGKTLDTGLWAWTRHPNYFGDCCQWWGIWFVCGMWWTVFAPLFLTFLLMKWSGVPLLEAGMKKSREGYSDYREKTPAFFPRPPKRSS